MTATTNTDTYTTSLTSPMLSCDANEDFRTAFNRLCRHVLATPGFEHEHSYMTDLIYDAVAMSHMSDDDRLFIVVSDVGTILCADVSGIHHAVSAYRKRALRVLRIVCTNPGVSHLPRTWRITDVSIDYLPTKGN